MTARKVCIACLLVCVFVLVPSVAARAEEDAAALVDHGHFLRARAIVEPRVKANPKDAEALWLLSQIRAAFGDLKAGLDLAEQAVALDERNARYHEQLAEVCGQMAGDAGLLKARSLAGRFRKEAEIACSLDSSYTDSRWALMEFYLQAPGIAGGSKDKGRAMAEEIARIDPIEGSLARVRLALMEKDTARAEDLTRKSLEVGPAAYRVHVRAAQLHAARRRWAEAEKEARLAREIEPDRAGPWLVLAGVMARQRHQADLDSTLAGAEAAVPDNWAPCYQAARAMIEEGVDFERAESYLKKYLGREPEGAMPTHAHAHWRLGQLYDKQGKKDAALAELETALKLDPDLDPAKKDLKRIKRG